MYIPLFNITNYSLLSSLLKINDLIEYAKKNNIPAISITDSNMFGTMEFIKKCEKNNIKPVIGLELLLENFNIVLFAKNYLGYKNLIKLSTIQNERIINIKDIEKYNKDLICVITFDSKDNYELISKIYEEIYIGYENKQQEKESLILTKNIVFFKKNLYLKADEKSILTYLYRIRDGKTLLDEIDYSINNNELYIDNLLDLTDNKGLLNTIKI